LISFEQWKLRIFLSVGRQKTQLLRLCFGQKRIRAAIIFSLQENIIINNERKMQHHSRQTTIIPEAKLRFFWVGFPSDSSPFGAIKFALMNGPKNRKCD